MAHGAFVSSSRGPVRPARAAAQVLASSTDIVETSICDGRSSGKLYLHRPASLARTRMLIQSQSLGKSPKVSVARSRCTRSSVSRCVTVCAVESKMDVGFVGLGIMGEPMAQNLLASGKFASVTVWNRTQAKVSELSFMMWPSLGSPRQSFMVMPSN